MNLSPLRHLVGDGNVRWLGLPLSPAATLVPDHGDWRLPEVISVLSGRLQLGLDFSDVLLKARLVEDADVSGVGSAVLVNDLLVEHEPVLRLVLHQGKDVLLKLVDLRPLTDADALVLVNLVFLNGVILADDGSRLDDRESILIRQILRTNLRELFQLLTDQVTFFMHSEEFLHLVNIFWVVFR